MNTAKLLERLPNATSAPAYAEPGYTATKGILFDDWNDVPTKLQDFLESSGFELEWSDEWTTCCDCGKAIRTSPDGYSWKPHYVLGEGDVVCLDCLDPEDHLEQTIDNPNTYWHLSETMLISLGFTRLNENRYESGSHRGQTDDPKSILQLLNEIRPGYEYVFGELDSEQFSMSFNIYSREI